VSLPSPGAGRRVGLLGLVIVLLVPAPALADPARPGDYRSVIDAIEPATTAVAVRIIGGDSFIELSVGPGHEVQVSGYGGEPYLHFGPDGVVLVNDNSPARYINEDRYGQRPVPTKATTDAVPSWRQVARAGTYLWHDHRTHWMSPAHPIGREPGDVVLEGSIAITVDGTRHLIRVSCRWEHPPTPVPAAIGVMVGASAVLVARRQVAAVLAVLAGAATILGVWEYRSVPAATGPNRLLWLAPLLGLALAMAAQRIRTKPPIATAASVGAGLELAVWVWVRRQGVAHPVLVTTAPEWLDRSVTTTAAAALATLSVSLLLRYLRQMPLRPRPG
jgi:hypothetical protein